MADAQGRGAFDPMTIFQDLMALPAAVRMDAADLVTRDLPRLAELLDKHGKKDAAAKVRAALPPAGRNG